MYKSGFKKGILSLKCISPITFSAGYFSKLSQFLHLENIGKSSSNLALNGTSTCTNDYCCNSSTKNLPTTRMETLCPKNRFRSGGEFSHYIQKRNFFGEKLDCLRKSALDESDKKDDWGDSEAAKLLLHITSDFYETIRKYDSVLVFFQAKWCGHCRKLKRPYAEAAVMLHKAGVPGTFAVFDIMSDPDVADQENIVGVPVLKYFRKGKFIALYSGKRTAEDLFNFMKNPPSDPVHVKKIEI